MQSSTNSNGVYDNHFTNENTHFIAALVYIYMHHKGISYIETYYHKCDFPKTCYFANIID